MPDRRARTTLAGFVALGLFWGAWAAVLPSVQDATGASKGALGVAMLFVSLGSLPAMLLLAGPAVDRFGARAVALGCGAFAVVASTCPASMDCPDCGRLHLDQTAIWRHFSLNTLDRLRARLDAGPGPAGGSHTAVFAGVYRRILECRVGDSLLDVGSNLGHLPVLLAERAPEVAVVGCDVRPEAIACCDELAAATGAGATFRLADVLAPEFGEVGRFDTVTAVHVLEHLAEDELPVALGQLLAVCRRRLIVAVPYEETPQPLYGHRQAFTPAKLTGWGEWCVAALGGGRSRCEDVGGGFLVVDRA